MPTFETLQNSVLTTAKFPEIGCSYIPPDQCTGFTPAPCCERMDNSGAGVVVMTSMVLLVVVSVLAVIV